MAPIRHVLRGMGNHAAQRFLRVSALRLNDAVQRANGEGPERPPGKSPTAPTPAKTPAPAPAKTPPRLDFGKACVSREEIPKDHNGAQGLQGIVHDIFAMEVDWDGAATDCRCTCGEYRQYVKGHVIVNGRPVPKRLYQGANLEARTYHEDADDAGRPYGHRTGYTNERIDKFIDLHSVADRETACQYRGNDTPGIPAPSGSNLDLHLWFKGQTYDRCRSTFGPIHEWETVWDGRVP